MARASGHFSKRLANKRCLIIGAGGIGVAAARRFLEEGASVILCDVDPAKEEARATLNDLGSVTFHACDVTSSAQVNELFSTIASGGLDVLFHVAGGSGRRQGDGPLHECSDDGWNSTLHGNLTGVFYSNRAAVRLFLQQGQGGVILNMASVLALDPAPRHFDTCAYAAAKGGIVSLTRLVAASYAARGIRVNALAPGLIDTPMSARAVGDPAIREFLAVKQPLGPGPGKPEDCAEAAVFLCSDEARFVTGVVLPVDGGWMIS